MRRWFTRAGAPVDTRFVKRFDPEQWTVDFPRGAMASVVTGATAHQLSVEARFLRLGDLVGLIWSSVDVGAHPAQARATSKDYSGCKLSFRWQSTGLMALDVTNGPTLTIEGRDALGAAKIWLVRLWNYAVGSGSDAVVSLDFDAMDAGYALPSEAVRVDARDIDRMFISLVAPDYVKDSTALRSSPAAGRVTVSNMASDGSGSVLKCGDALSPENGLGIATAYDDMYNVAPSRVVEGLVRAGFRGTINHYVGMSHYPALGSDGKVDPALNMCAPAKEWHRELARCAKLHGYRLIWSLSFELLDMFCPDAWKQRDRTGNSAATGYVPPSTLVSPASSPGIAYFGRIAAELVGLSVEQGLVPRFQVGEPWWWVDASGKIYLYDTAAVAAFGGAPVAIDDVGASLSAGQKSLLDLAGVKLAAATGQVVAAAKAAAPGTVSHVLAYLPGLLDPARPEVRRANLPVGWAKPAFDVLQLEEYEWVTGARSALRASARATVEARLGYARGEQHYLSGFASSSAALGEWDEIVAAAGGARRGRTWHAARFLPRQARAGGGLPVSRSVRFELGRDQRRGRGERSIAWHGRWGDDAVRAHQDLCRGRGAADHAAGRGERGGGGRGSAQGDRLEPVAAGDRPVRRRAGDGRGGDRGIPFRRSGALCRGPDRGQPGELCRGRGAERAVDRNPRGLSR